jgi:hypothetical protein
MTAPFLLAILLATAPAAATQVLQVETTQNTPKLMPYQVFELTFRHEGDYQDPTWDVSIDVTFTSPSGRKARVGGFFYGSSHKQTPPLTKAGENRPPQAEWPCQPADLWKARFAPGELGRWKFDYQFTAPGGRSATGGGQFQVVEGRVRQKGFVRIDPQNPFRFVFDDGSPFFPIGYQDGIFDNNANGSVMDSEVTEGPFRPDPEGTRPTPPPGALFARGPSMGPTNGDVTFGRHARAGFNCWRFSPNNFSIKVFADPKDANRATLDHVRWEQARMVDELLQMTRKYKMCNMYGIFGYTKVFNDQPDDREGMEKVKRIIKYSVDRWGAYVDFWEFLNEQHAATGWYEVVIPYLESIDPYDHPVTTSWERPELAGIEVNAPHWYGNEPELQSDRETVHRAEQMKHFGKPVVYGEQGNYRGREDQSARGIGGVWDPGSARRMRVRCWTAMFQEISFIFWETSYAKDGHVRNIWIGPQERQYIRVMQDFAGLLDRNVRMTRVPLAGSSASEVNAYGLGSAECVAVYLHHAGCEQCRRASSDGEPSHHDWNHDRGEVRGLKLTIDVPAAATGVWYRPTDGEVLGTFDAVSGPQTVATPPFSIDLALIVSNRDLPDSDGDGIPNRLDPDDDNDTVPDGVDAWPLEREEWADADGDRIGDNLDADVDGDGRADDRNQNGTPDNLEADRDGDGVPQADSIPWDAFPLDPTEWQDTDGDGIGNNRDGDDDGDGHADREEQEAGTDPLDPLDFP